MSEEYNADCIKSMKPWELIRERPHLYIGDLKFSELTTQLFLQSLSHAIDEIINGNCTRIDVVLSKNEAEVNLGEDEIGISPGQACVFYSKNKFGDKVLGGGWISNTVNNYLST